VVLGHVAAAWLEVCIWSLCWFICIHSSIGAEDAAVSFSRNFWGRVD